MYISGNIIEIFRNLTVVKYIFLALKRGIKCLFLLKNLHARFSRHMILILDVLKEDMSINLRDKKINFIFLELYIL